MEGIFNTEYYLFLIFNTPFQGFRLGFDFFQLVQLLGALGLFLFGMKYMSDSLLLLAGNKMRAILATMTSNRVFGIFTGFLITSVIQSSSATTLMVVSFSNASLLTLTEAIAVIMGANIGTTITAWLIAILGFKVNMSTLALPLVGTGVLFGFSKKEQLKNWGSFIIGFALLFLGLQFLKDAMPDIDNSPEVLAFLRSYTDLGFLSVLLFLFIGTVLTVVIQSSSATMALTLVMTAQGWIPYEMAAAMVLGENVGTTVTANLAAMVANFRAKRAARAHLIFNLIGVVWMLVLFYPFLKLVDLILDFMGAVSPYAEAAAIPVAISVFHTVFNITNTFLLAWFIHPIAKLVERMVPPSATPDLAIEEPKYLNKRILKYPETAIASLGSESRFLFENALFEIIAHSMNIHRTDVLSDLKAKKVVKKSREDFKTDVRELYLTKVKTIYGEIITYATHAQSRLKLSEAQNNRIAEIKIANRKMVVIIKEIGDLNRNMSLYLESGNKDIQSEYDSLRKITVKVLRTLYGPLKERNTEEYYRELINLKGQVNNSLKKRDKAIEQLIREEKIDSIMASSLFNDLDTIKDLFQDLIEIAELLYCKKDPLFENGEVSKLETELV